MRESYRLSGRSELLYNIARLEDEGGDCSASLADYRQYLERVPQGQYRSAAAQASTDLRARCRPAADAEQQPASVPAAAVDAGALASSALPTTSPVSTQAAEPASTAPAAPPVDRAKPASPAPAAGNTRRWLGWSAVAAGGLASAGAIYFTVSALNARSRFRSSLQTEADGGPYADFGLRDDQHRDQRWAAVLGVAGGALLGGGVLVLVLGSRTPASAAVTAGVWLEPGRISAQLSSSF